MECVKAASFLWLVTPDGYVGQSASMEIGVAVSAGTPIYSQQIPSDVTLRQYVSTVASVADVAKALRQPSTQRASAHILIEPVDSAETLHRALDELVSVLVGPHARLGSRAERTFAGARRAAANTFGVVPGG